MKTNNNLPEKDSIFSVSDISLHIKNLLESNISNLYIEGEIANFTHHNSGHIYMSLKDNKSTIKCVFFKGYNQYLGFKPKTGDNVICLGKITVYERGGNYQLNIIKMIPSGKGLLDAKFEELKRKLAAEGLFDTSRKKEIAKYPEVIGVVTSATGAALQDIKNVISRRYPCRILLYPATVQGDKAPQEIIKGIRYFNLHKNADTIIIGRGGGSQEDLFCFNDEKLARTIAASDIPIISSVGHEIDFTISDFVADLRAPTPSAAAELAVPDSKEILETLKVYNHRITSCTKGKIFTYKLFISNIQNNLQQFHPQNILRNYQQRIDEANIKLDHLLTHKISNFKQLLNLETAKVEALSPYNALKRGYSIIRQESRILNSVQSVEVNDKLEIMMQDGSLECVVNEIKNK